jgi:hypothetical protein
MSLPLPASLARHFSDRRYRGFSDFREGHSGQFSANVEFLITGSEHEGRWAQLAWVFNKKKFERVRFLAAGDPYLIGIFSWFCSFLEGNSKEALSTISFPQIARDLKIPDHKLSCLLMLEDVVNQLIKR